MESYIVKDETKLDTLKVVEKTETKEVVTNISIQKEIRSMENDKADIVSILSRFNGHLALYNEAIGADGTTKLASLADATASFPAIPAIEVEVVEEVLPDPIIKEIIK